MSRRRRYNPHWKSRPRDARPAAATPEARSYRSGSQSFTIGTVFAASRLGTQGPGHPPAEASFEERLAPYTGLVDGLLRQAAEHLGGNVDVSFMKDDFQRFIAERMLLTGMSALLSSNAGSARCSELLEHLVEMIEDRRKRRRPEFSGPSLNGPMRQAISDHASMMPRAFQAP
ncbi:hypothetical protein ACVIGB_001113 [Bradyrhizobium sp. USDA 4341]